MACAEVSSPPCCARVRGFRPSSTMSSSSSTSTLACPVCDDPFRGAGSPSEPRVYPCSHTVCGQCAEAAALAPVAYCSVCCAVVNGTGVLNAGLAEYAESCFQANEAAIDSNDLLPAAGSPGGPAPFRPTSYSDAMSSISVDGDGLDADQSAATSSKVASSAPPLGDEPAEDNTIHELRSSLAAVEARCDSAAESLTATADAVLSGIASLHSRTRESYEAYSSAIDELIASLTSQRNRLLAEAAQLCAQRVKVS